ncbi:SET domain-containing protein [Daedalea quercina L-15889]|uniref:SET domain-containing protein n=1 Tax=Daedalea quercina L-15889 TaxID=1314783 RepID=A0A165N7K7_9APHY|nr:SET domain-containing protein [Daedalea quercina L-15889]
MPKSTAIGEYIAELFPNEFNEQLDIVQKHRHLNYTFTLNADHILDSAWVGNDTRYLNHAQGEGENTTAEIQWVSGEHRILFFTTRYIKKGEELLFNYGENYWLG